MILCSLASLFSMLGYPEWASRTFIVAWAHLNLAVSFVGVDVEGLEKIDHSQSYVIAANHQSLYDIYVLYGFTGIDAKWVMKKELRRIPFLGLSAEKMGHIIIDRSSPEQAIETINIAKQRITNGISVVFFPEGTRSRDGNLLPFKKGAFRLALDLGLPILPISIHGSRDVLPSDTMELTPGRIRMVIHDPIPLPRETDPGNGTAVMNLLTDTRQVLTDALREA
jgi:1-acyl-sn-glycerol-3-phosphate acyltransferase